MGDEGVLAQIHSHIWRPVDVLEYVQSLHIEVSHTSTSLSQYA